MSMNIMIEGRRQVQVINTGKISEQRIIFNVWQTPTSITKEIIISRFPASVYKDWVLSISEDKIVEVFAEDEDDIWGEGEPIGITAEDDIWGEGEPIGITAEDDIWGEGEPIGITIENFGKEHVAEFEDWLKMCESEGYDVSFHML